MRIKHWAIVAGWIFIATITAFLLWQLPGVLREGQTRFGQPAPFYYLNLISWILIIAFFFSLGRHSQASKVLILVWFILILGSAVWEYQINYIAFGRLAVRIICSLFVVLLVLKYSKKIGGVLDPKTYEKTAS